MILPSNISIVQDDTTIKVRIEIDSSRINIEQVDADLCVDQFDFIFSAEPYYLKLKFNQMLMEGGPSMFIEKQPSIYRISVGKMNYKEHFTGLEDVQSLVQGFDEELSDVLV